MQEKYYFSCDCPKCLVLENNSEIAGAACPNQSCDNSITINNDEANAKCSKCGIAISDEFKSEFNNVVEFTTIHLDNMKNTTCIL